MAKAEFEPEEIPFIGILTGLITAFICMAFEAVDR